MNDRRETMTDEQLTDEELWSYADRWYKLLDVHAPVEEILPLLADDELEMVFPEATVHGHDGFKGWYDAVTNRFFDEVHTLKEVTSAGGDVKVVVNWQAKIWNPPAPKSEWLGFDAYQTWRVRRGTDGQPQLTRYVVDELAPMPGSASL
jgi:SnoaL-like domain